MGKVYNGCCAMCTQWEMLTTIKLNTISITSVTFVWTWILTIYKMHSLSEFQVIVQYY